MTYLPKSSPYRPIGSSLDRLEEAHWFLHQMEEYYHFADPFRYSLNAFLKALKEVPQILQMELQNRPGFSEWYRSRRDAARNDPLLSTLAKKRDVVVHQAALYPSSSAMIGRTRGRGIRSGMGVTLDPRLDSDWLMLHYVKTLLEDRHEGKPALDIFGFLEEPDDSLPCVERTWRLDEFPDTEILDLAEAGWRTAGTLVSDVAEWIGAEPLELAMDCRHSANSVRMRMYGHDIVMEVKDALEAGVPADEIYWKMRFRKLGEVRDRHQRYGV